MTGPAATSSPDIPHPQPQGGTGSGSGSTGRAVAAAGAGEGGSSYPSSVRSRPVTRPAAAMSSGRSTRQQQSKSTTASPITPADKLRHQHQQQQQQPTTPPPTKGSSSTSAGGAAKRGEVSVNTPPPTAPPPAATTTTTSARSPATARSAGSGQSNTTPTPTTQTNTSGGASHHYQTRHSYHPLESSTHQQQESGPAARASAGNNRKRSAATASIDTTASNTSAGTGGNQQFDDPRIDRRSLDTPITVNTPGTATSPTSYRGSGFGTTGSSSGGGGPAGPELMCLCAKEPKVPRPRNAFILYRQHHQSQTVAANPGTANPEISKIIGAQWKNEPEERKAQWKRLADEEKLRHQQQYPGYKYTPRRSKSAKGGSGADSAVSTPLSATFPSLGDGERPDCPGRCPKCGGRDIAIATPRTPSTPFPGRMFPANTSGVPGIAAAMPSGGIPPTPSQGGGAGSGNWGEGAPRHKRGTSVDVGGEYYRERDRRQQQQFPQYQYGSSNPGPTPYPHKYPPQHGGPGGGGGGYTPYPGANERDRMMNARNWPPPPPSGPPSAYNQPPPPSFHDRLYDIREAEYEMGTPVAASPFDAKRRRYNDGEYYRYQQAPLSPPPPMGYGGRPPPPGGPGQGQYGYPPGPPPPQSPHPRPSIHGPPPGSGPGQPPLLTRSTPTMGPPPPPRGGSTTPVYHSPPAQPDPRPHSESGSRGGGRGSSHRDQARERDAEFEQPLRLPPLQTHLPPQDQTSLPPTAASGRLGGSSSTSPMELSSATPTGVTMAGGLNISYAAMGGSGRFPDSAIDLTLDGGHGGRRLSLPSGSVGASQTGPPERMPYKAPGTGAMATIRPKSGPSSITSQPLSNSSSIDPSHKRKFDAMDAGEGPTGTSREEKSALEAMIMSMHYLSKLTVLSEKIVCPLPLPGAGNHPQAGGKTVRGPIIAIEGTNLILMKAVAMAVEKALKSGNICRLRKWEGAAGPLSFSAESERAEKTPVPSGTRQASESASKRSKSASGSAARADEEVERAGVPGSASSAAGDAAGRASESPSETKTPTPAVPLPVPGSGSSSKDAAGETAGSKAGSQAPGSRTSSLGSILSHHSEKSHHTDHSHHSEKSHHSHHSQNTRHSDRSSTGVVIIQDNKPSNPYVSYWTELSAWHTRSAEITNFVTGQTTTTAASSSSPARESSPTENDLLPVALLPSGYCLTYSDRFACSTQISDSYAPVDHWQWMATMWRGLVAPDLTIYVLDEASPFARDHLHGEDDYGAGGYDSGQTVEFKRTNLKMAVMVVRLNEASGGLSEKTERRLGFEVLEWVRNGPFSGVIGDGEIL